MEKYLIFVLTSLFCVLATPRTSKQYRSDYEYNIKSDAFYKFHTEFRRKQSADHICDIEGAKLMLIESQEDLLQAHGMFKRYPELPNHAWVEQDGRSHEQADGQLNYLYQATFTLQLHCDALSRDGDIEDYMCFEMLPFFCKVSANVAVHNLRCGVYGTNYEYVPSTNSCYKVSANAYSWNEAFAECRAEGAHLLIINSVAESQVVQNLTRNVKPAGSRFPWFFFIGIRAAVPDGNESPVFRTIFNETLEEAGFNAWSLNEPNNAQGNELCGSFFVNDAKLNDVTCSNDYGFICEKEVPPGP